MGDRPIDRKVWKEQVADLIRTTTRGKKATFARPGVRHTPKRPP